MPLKTVPKITNPQGHHFGPRLCPRSPRGLQGDDFCPRLCPRSPRGAPREPFLVQDGAQDRQEEPQGDYLRAKMVSKRLPRCSKSASERSKRLPRRSKRLPRGSQERQTAPKKLQKASKSFAGLVFVSHCFDLLQTQPRLRLGFD